MTCSGSRPSIEPYGRRVIAELRVVVILDHHRVVPAGPSRSFSPVMSPLLPQDELAAVFCSAMRAVNAMSVVRGRPVLAMRQASLINLLRLMYYFGVGSTMFPDAPTTPPGFLRLTGHPVRWQLLSELARSDRQVRELTALVGQRQSLTSYHLGQLRQDGLVKMRRSSADKRDTYYSLDLAACRERLAAAGSALHPGLRLVPAALTPPADGPGRSPTKPPVRVLFLCTGNSARSQMAQAILEQVGGTQVEVASAGSHPKALHHNAVRVMRERGIDISGRRSKHLSEYAEQRFDHVISLCDRVREVCPDFPGPPVVAHWSIPDPVTEATANEDSYPVFARTADDLTTRIQFLYSAIEHTRTSS
jgi:protein-tyrosine-phosphatase/DNA-binding transcriptional ArsR family regulator